MRCLRNDSKYLVRTFFWCTVLMHINTKSKVFSKFLFLVLVYPRKSESLSTLPACRHLGIRFSVLLG